jgi:hypothetical protein
LWPTSTVVSGAGVEQPRSRGPTQLEQRFDLAWRTLCHGRLSDTLAVPP